MTIQSVDEPKRPSKPKHLTREQFGTISDYDGNSIFWFSDLHLRTNTPKQNRLMLMMILKIIKETRPKYAINTGDTLHTKNIISGSMLNLYRWFVKEVTKYTTLITVVGNHDWCEEHTLHPFFGFDEIPNHIVVDGHYRISESIGVMAYCRTKERFIEQKTALGKVKVLFGHFAFNDFDLGSGYEEKDSWCEADLFEGVEVVLSGHWHAAQEMVMKGIRVIYLGSPATIEAGESDQLKRVAFFNPENYNLLSLDTGLTLHKTIRMTVDDPLPELPKEDIEKGVEYRIHVAGTMAQLSRFRLPRNYPGILMKEYVQAEEKRIKLSTTESRPSAVRKYVVAEMTKTYGPDETKWPHSADFLVEEGLRLCSVVKRSI